jgi:hypothetical protein
MMLATETIVQVSILGYLSSDYGLPRWPKTAILSLITDY